MVFFFNATAPTEIYTLSLHDALPIYAHHRRLVLARTIDGEHRYAAVEETVAIDGDRKSTRLNSSHVSISYAVFCLKKKTTKILCAAERPSSTEHPAVIYILLSPSVYT